MTVKKLNTFETLNALNVSEHIEKKGQFSYLSWPWAVQQLRKSCPTATWEVVKHEGLPYTATDCGYFVEVAVTIDDVTLSQIHPVLDNRNQTISKPNAFQINTSIQRCLVKAIALHGLGLYIYAGEDLPDDENQSIKAAVKDLSSHRGELGKKLMAKFDGDGEAVKQWLVQENLPSVRASNEEQLSQIEAAL